MPGRHEQQQAEEQGRAHRPGAERYHQGKRYLGLLVLPSMLGSERERERARARAHLENPREKKRESTTTKTKNE